VYPAVPAAAPQQRNPARPTDTPVGECAFKCSSSAKALANLMPNILALLKPGTMIQGSAPSDPLMSIPDDASCCTHVMSLACAQQSVSGKRSVSRTSCE